MPRLGCTPSPPVPWGIHFCSYYRSTSELQQLVTSYLQTGLEDHEGCLWILPPVAHTHQCNHGAPVGDPASVRLPRDHTVGTAPLRRLVWLARRDEFSAHRCGRPRQDCANVRPFRGASDHL